MTPQELRSSILQLAMQGKLTSREKEDGSTDELAKSFKRDPGIIPSEPPFDIPESWLWVPLGDLGASAGTDSFCDGPFGSNLKTEHYTDKKEVRIIQLSNIGELGWKDKNVKYTTYEHLETAIPRCEVHPGDFVIAKMMPAGRTIIVPDLGTRITLGSDAMKFVPNPILNKEYLLYAMRSQAFLGQIYGEVHGITRVRTSLKKMKTYVLPIPPLAEQARIVAKIEELMPLVDRYEKAFNELNELNEAFPIDMEKSILQLAVEGKLVEQKPEEGTGQELFVQIQDERNRLWKSGTIKKESKLSDANGEEKPFDIPSSWKWVRLGFVISLLSGCDLSPDHYSAEMIGMPYLTGASNIQNGRLIINRWTDAGKNISHRGDLLLTCKGTVGKTCILDVEEAHIARQYMALTAIGFDTAYLELFIQIMVPSLVSKSKGLIPGIERKDVLNLLLPLPPLAEQKRIVAKVEELMPLIDKLASKS